jgi:hypothetical protein
VLGQLRRFQTAINAEGYPGGTYTTPVSLPSFTSFNRYNESPLYANDNWSLGSRLTVNLGLRYEVLRPADKSEPKFDSNFYLRRPERVGSTPAHRPISSAASPPATPLPTNESPIGACGSRTGTTGHPVSDLRGT